MLRFLPIPGAALDPAGQTLGQGEWVQISREPKSTVEGVGRGTSLSVRLLKHSGFSFLVSLWMLSSGFEMGRKKKADGPGFWLGQFVGKYLLFYGNPNPEGARHFCRGRKVSEGNGHNSGQHVVVASGAESIQAPPPVSSMQLRE